MQDLNIVLQDLKLLMGKGKYPAINVLKILKNSILDHSFSHMVECEFKES